MYVYVSACVCVCLCVCVCVFNCVGAKVLRHNSLCHDSNCKAVKLLISGLIGGGGNISQRSKQIIHSFDHIKGTYC